MPDRSSWLAPPVAGFGNEGGPKTGIERRSFLTSLNLTIRETWQYVLDKQNPPLLPVELQTMPDGICSFVLYPPHSIL